jgi:DNA polymerase-4
VISLQEAPAFLDTLPIEQFFGVGKVTATKLRQAKVASGADLRRLGEEQLHALLGNYGNTLYRLACARDDRPVEPTRERKSVGKETTFERDLVDRARMEEIVEQLATHVEQRLAELGLRGRTLTLKVKWSNSQLITRSASSPHGFSDAQTMTPVLHTLLRQLGGTRRPVRLLGVTVSNFLTPDEVRRSGQVVALRLWE